MADSLSRITTHLKTAYDKAGLSDRASRKRAAMKFAQTHNLIYFGSSKATSANMQIVRGVTGSIDQQDRNICIGTHAGYDIVFLERTATVGHPDYPASSHQWLIMGFDLHTHSNLPFTFIGTRQQSRAFYARLFSTRREVRQLDPLMFNAPHHFASHYTVIASPAEQLFLAQLLTTPVTTDMARHQHPFAIEIQADTLYVIAEAQQVNEGLLSKMLHYGLWIAGHIDSNVAK